jgi:hypothetical protein
MAETKTTSSYEDNVNGTLDTRRAAHQIGQQMQNTALDQWSHMINLWQPAIHSVSIWQKAVGDGLETMANRMKQEVSKLHQQY